MCVCVCVLCVCVACVACRMEGMDMAQTPELTTSKEVYLIIAAWPRAIMAAEVGVRYVHPSCDLVWGVRNEGPMVSGLLVLVDCGVLELSLIHI